MQILPIVDAVEVVDGMDDRDALAGEAFVS